MSEILRKRDVPHAVIDVDYLRYAFPRPKDDPFYQTLGIKNLASIWGNYKAIGINKIIIPNVVESRTDVDAIAQVIPGAKVSVVRIKANLNTVHKRLHKRHNNRDNENLTWHLDRAVELNNQLEDSKIEDFIVDSENKSLKKVAEEILKKWLN